jgi:hypothetical protein
MTVQLPKPIEGYFTADRDGSADAVAAWFTEDGIVKDEGETHRGRDDIRAWKAGSTKKYTYTVEPFAIEDQDGRILVRSHLVGDFPGSPVDLRYFFGLDGERIAALEIVP